MNFRIFLVFMFLFPLLGNAASKVYKCKDATGRIVFQQVACNESQITGNSSAHDLWRKMRALSSEGKNILAVLGADLESIKQCNRSIETFNSKVEELTPAVRQVGRQYPELVKAHTYLKDCGVCRTSSEANCRTADKYLNQAVSKLTEY
jgi:hypothetical protein